MPLRHLIVLIVDAHPSAEARVRNCFRPAASTSSLKRPASHCRQWCGQHPMIASKGVATFPTTRPCCHGTVDQCPIHDVIQPCMVRRRPACMDHAKQIFADKTLKILMDRAQTTLPSSSSTQEKWWSQTGSNRRPHACKARALPTELWPHHRMPQAKSSRSFGHEAQARTV